MKKIYLILLTIMVVGMIASCTDYLESDQYFKDRMTLDKVFTSEEYTEQWLAHTFSFLTGFNAEVTSKGITPHNFADDMYYGDRDAAIDINLGNELSYSRFKLGEYNENEKQGGWGDSYKGIRNATVFIQHIDQNTIFSAEKRAD